MSKDLKWDDPEFLEWEQEQIGEELWFEVEGCNYIQCVPGRSSGFVRGVGFSNSMFTLKSTGVTEIGSFSITNFAAADEEDLRDAQL